MATFTPEFSQVFLTQLAPGATSPDFTVPADKIWKIESAGIGGTKGAIYLNSGTGVTLKTVAIIFSTISDNDYGVHLPFTLPAGFVGSIKNDSNNDALVSITEYELVTL